MSLRGKSIRSNRSNRIKSEDKQNSNRSNKSNQLTPDVKTLEKSSSRRSNIYNIALLDSHEPRKVSSFINAVSSYLGKESNILKGSNTYETSLFNTTQQFLHHINTLAILSDHTKLNKYEKDDESVKTLFSGMLLKSNKKDRSKIIDKMFINKRDNLVRRRETYASTDKEYKLQKKGGFLGGNVYRNIAYKDNFIVQGTKQIVPADKARYEIQKKQTDPKEKYPGLPWTKEKDIKDFTFRIYIQDPTVDKDSGKAIYFETEEEACGFRDRCIIESRGKGYKGQLTFLKTFAITNVSTWFYQKMMLYVNSNLNQKSKNEYDEYENIMNEKTKNIKDSHYIHQERLELKLPEAKWEEHIEVLLKVAYIVNDPGDLEPHYAEDYYIEDYRNHMKFPLQQERSTIHIKQKDPDIFMQREIEDREIPYESLDDYEEKDELDYNQSSLYYQSDNEKNAEGKMTESFDDKISQERYNEYPHETQADFSEINKTNQSRNAPAIDDKELPRKVKYCGLINPSILMIKVGHEDKGNWPTFVQMNIYKIKDNNESKSLNTTKKSFNNSFSKLKNSENEEESSLIWTKNVGVLQIKDDNLFFKINIENESIFIPKLSGKKSFIIKIVDVLSDLIIFETKTSFAENIDSYNFYQSKFISKRNKFSGGDRYIKNICLFYNIVVMADNFYDTERLILDNQETIEVLNIEPIKKFYTKEINSRLDSKQPIRLSIVSDRTEKYEPTDKEKHILKTEIEQITSKEKPPKTANVLNLKIVLPDYLFSAQYNCDSLKQYCYGFLQNEHLFIKEKKDDEKNNRQSIMNINEMIMFLASRESRKSTFLDVILLTEMLLNQSMKNESVLNKFSEEVKTFSFQIYGILLNDYDRNFMDSVNYQIYYFCVLNYQTSHNYSFMKDKLGTLSHYQKNTEEMSQKIEELDLYITTLSDNMFYCSPIIENFNKDLDLFSEFNIVANRSIDLNSFNNSLMVAYKILSDLLRMHVSGEVQYGNKEGEQDKKFQTNFNYLFDYYFFKRLNVQEPYFYLRNGLENNYMIQFSLITQIFNVFKSQSENITHVYNDRNKYVNAINEHPQDYYKNWQEYYDRLNYWILFSILKQNHSQKFNSYLKRNLNFFKEIIRDLIYSNFSVLTKSKKLLSFWKFQLLISILYEEMSKTEINSENVLPINMFHIIQAVTIFSLMSTLINKDSGFFFTGNNDKGTMQKRLKNIFYENYHLIINDIIYSIKEWSKYPNSIQFFTDSYKNYVSSNSNSKLKPFNNPSNTEKINEISEKTLEEADLTKGENYKLLLTMKKFTVKFRVNENVINNLFESIMNRHVSTLSSIEIIDQKELFENQILLVDSEVFFDTISKYLKINDQFVKVITGLFCSENSHDGSKIRFVDFFVLLTIADEFISNSQKIWIFKKLLEGIFGVIEKFEIHIGEFDNHNNKDYDSSTSEQKIDYNSLKINLFNNFMQLIKANYFVPETFAISNNFYNGEHIIDKGIKLEKAFFSNDNITYEDITLTSVKNFGNSWLQTNQNKFQEKNIFCDLLDSSFSIKPELLNEELTLNVLYKNLDSDEKFFILRKQLALDLKNKENVKIDHVKNLKPCQGKNSMDSYLNSIKSNLISESNSIIDEKISSYVNYSLKSANKQILNVQSLSIVRVKSLIISIDIRISNTKVQTLIFCLSNKYLFPNKNESDYENYNSYDRENAMDIDQIENFIKNEFSNEDKTFILINEKETSACNLFLPAKYFISVLLQNAKENIDMLEDDLETDFIKNLGNEQSNIDQSEDNYLNFKQSYKRVFDATYDKDLKFRRNFKGEISDKGFGMWNQYSGNGEKMNKDSTILCNQYISSCLNITNFAQTSDTKNYTNIKLVLEIV